MDVANREPGAVDALTQFFARVLPLSGMGAGLLARLLVNLFAPSESTQLWVWELVICGVLAFSTDIVIAALRSNALARSVCGALLTGYAATSAALAYLRVQEDGVLPAIGLAIGHFLACTAVAMLAVVVSVACTRQFEQRR